jgi:nicotinate phosphoribosyltransferase
MVEVEIFGIKRFTAKYSEEKTSLPGAKQVFRFADRDVLARAGECANAPALVRPVILNGNLVEPLPDVNAARETAAKGLRALPAGVRALDPGETWPVECSQELGALIERTRRNLVSKS